MLLGAANAFYQGSAAACAIGKARDPLDSTVKPAHEAARNLQRHQVRWCIIGDDNYGEGSSREHAALEPRFLGGTAVIARSFARIHETNLKKQGMLALTFADPADWDRVCEGDSITLLGVEDGEMQPGEQVQMQVTPRVGERWTAALDHSYHAHQIRWLRAGSALNYIKETFVKELRK